MVLTNIVLCVQILVTIQIRISENSFDGSHSVPCGRLGVTNGVVPIRSCFENAPKFRIRKFYIRELLEIYDAINIFRRIQLTKLENYVLYVPHRAL